MSGVTLITHGFQFSAGTPQWLTAMGNSISDQAGGASQYRLTLSPDGNSISKVGDQSIAVSSNPNGEIILLVDWSAWSNSFLHPLTYTDWVSDQIMPALTGTFASIGIVNPLIEQPIHLIGHSRGGSLVSSLASKLALNDIWVDQLTTLDPDPVLADKYPDVPDNVSFADNYYQNTDNYLVTGLAVDGAAGIGPLNLPGGNPELLSGIASIGDHADVHTWYQGTIDTSANAADGVVTSIPSNWYTGNQGPRDSVGFAWSRIGGAKRPASGQALSGATRAATTVTATGSAAWDNVLIRNLQTSTDLKRGTAVELDTYVGDINRDSTLTFGFDFDSNPYNGTVSSNSWTTASISNTYPTPLTYQMDTSGLSPGSYHVFAKISNGVNTRYDYSLGEVTVTVPTVSIGDVTVDEAAGNASLSVTLSTAPATDVTVQYSTASGSATAGQDYTTST